MITSASFVRYEQVGPSTYQVVVALVDSVDGPKEGQFLVSGATLPEVTNDLRRQIAARNTSLGLKGVLDGIVPGTNIPVTAPSVPPPTAKEQFFLDVARLKRVKQAADAGLTGLAATQTALVASLNTALGANPSWAAEF